MDNSANVKDFGAAGNGLQETIDNKNPLILVVTNLSNFKIKNFKRERKKEPQNKVGHNKRMIDDRGYYKEILFTALKD